MITTEMLKALRAVVGDQYVLTDSASLTCYGYDPFLERHSPPAAVFPGTVEEAAAVVRLLSSADIAYLARGSGTGYVGAGIPTKDEILIVTTRLNRIREVNTSKRYAVVEAGVITANLQAEVARFGLMYPPDPSSFNVCTIGGNVATNAGGPHCLGYGVTSNYVLDIESVSTEGEIVTTRASQGLLDIRGIMCGSEHYVGLITAIKLRLIPAPKVIQAILARFSTNAPAVNAICKLFETGCKPIALDMTTCLSHPSNAPIPINNDCVLYIELHGDEDGVSRQSRLVCQTVEACGGSVSKFQKFEYMKKRFETTQERWQCASHTFGQLNYFLFDAVVKRSNLGEILDRVETEAREAGFMLSNTFHAGDGNIHPTPFYDPRSPNIKQQLYKFRDKVCAHVRSLDGALTGEHGVGLEKTHLMADFFGERTLSVMRGVADILRPDLTDTYEKVLPPPSNDHKPLSRGELHSEKISAMDGYAVFDAALTLKDIAAKLKNSPYELALEPIGRSDNLTIGEIIEFGPPCLRSFRYGPARNCLLGGVLVLPDGREIEFGSVFAKDVSGIDLRKVVFGSKGSLGKLKTVVLKLEPRRGRRMILRLGTGKAELQQVMDKLMQSEGLYSAIWLTHDASGFEVATLLDCDASSSDRAITLMTEGHHGPCKSTEWKGTAGDAFELSEWVECDVQISGMAHLMSDEFQTRKSVGKEIRLLDFATLSPFTVSSGQLPPMCELTSTDKDLIEVFQNVR